MFDMSILKEDEEDEDEEEEDSDEDSDEEKEKKEKKEKKVVSAKNLKRKPVEKKKSGFYDDL